MSEESTCDRCAAAVPYPCSDVEVRVRTQVHDPMALYETRVVQSMQLCGKCRRALVEFLSGNRE